MPGVLRRGSNRAEREGVSVSTDDSPKAPILTILQPEVAHPGVFDFLACEEAESYTRERLSLVREAEKRSDIPVTLCG